MKYLFVFTGILLSVFQLSAQSKHLVTSIQLRDANSLKPIIFCSFVYGDTRNK